MVGSPDHGGLAGAARLRAGVYTDYPYHEADGGVYAERAFAKFLGRLASRFAGMTVIGRRDPEPERARYRLPDGVRFVPLPHYGRLTDVRGVLAASLGSIIAFWRALDELDVVWLLGPHPFAFAFLAVARIRRRAVVLGVRQNSVEYMRNRHPGRRLHLLVAWAMEGAFRLLAGRYGAVAVGPDIAARYGGRAPVLEISVSLVEDSQVVDSDTAFDRDYEGELTVLSVGRIESEKNPLLLADTLGMLDSSDDRWRLTICGEGSMEAELRDRLAELGLADRAELRGYVPFDGGLLELYRQAHAFLHVSWTEGLPQTLIEALAAGLPTVATDVGGIRQALGEALVMVPPGDAAAATEALERIADDPELRRRLVERGLELVASMTIDHECDRVAAYIGHRGGLGR